MTTVTTVNINLVDKTVAELTFIEVLFLIILGWILVVLWQRVIENFAYNTIGLDKSSAYINFVVALFFTSIFIAFIFFSGTLISTTKSINQQIPQNTKI